MRPIRGGLRLEGKKEATLTPWTIHRPSPPRRVLLPGLATWCQAPRLARLGEKIGETREGIPVHASISGEVRETDGGVEIVSDGREESLPEIGHERPGWDSLPPTDLQEIIRSSGAAPLGQNCPLENRFAGTGSPEPDRQNRIAVDTVILNGCESEPYLTSDHALMMSHPLEILKGGEILRRALGAKEVVVATEENKEEVAELLRSKIFFQRGSHLRVEVLPSRYPQGHPSLLTESLELDAPVFGISEAFAVYEAVVLQKPFYERVVTLSGECLAQPKNVWLRVGTMVDEAVKSARGFLREPGKVVLGGPMTGIEISDLKTPIDRSTPGILALGREVLDFNRVEPCIRCGRCVEACPVSISPALISLAVEKELFELAEEYGAPHCIGCGNCAYVCPAKRPMVQLIQRARTGSTGDTFDPAKLSPAEPVLRNRFCGTGSPVTVPQMIWTAVAAALPAALVYLFYFGGDALRILSVAGLAAVLTEIAARKFFKRRVSVYDGSALLTGLLLALMLPPSVPSWAAALGAAFAIFFGREIFGGLGENPFNPTLVGFAFLLLILGPWGEGANAPLSNPAMGGALSVGGVILLWSRLIHWEIPFLYLGTLFLVQAVRPEAVAAIFSVPALLAAFFFVTDPATTPLTRKGERWFAVGSGLLSVIGIPQALLVMNALNPWLDRWCRPKRERKEGKVSDTLT